MAGVTATMVQTTRVMVRTALGSRVFGSNPTLITHPQVRFVSSPSPSDTAKRAIDELKNAGSQIKEKTASHAGYVANQSKAAAGATENITEKAKQSAQEAWSATKDAAQKVQDTVVGKAEASADVVKDHIEAAKRTINTK
ncbi:uncharacterized protein At4g13230 [Lactuca sativa]|uniref:uncharacterized protein At4g13230 n=1 Tax=Lactuca sativa TaxID=4236 RepID=UPI000CA98CD6|nr:uncharacterized protein At4g13230 [Lactuca sativa]